MYTWSFLFLLNVSFGMLLACYLIYVFRKVCTDVRKLLIFKRVSIILRLAVVAVFIRLNPGLEKREVSFTKILCRRTEQM